MKMAVIGIDLGTTNSLAVTYRNGQIEMIPNVFGEYLTPSVVSFVDGQLVVGKIAKERLVTDPEHTTSLFKRNMGTDKMVTLGKSKFRAEELSAFVVKQLVTDAESYLNDKVEEVVISVPAYFDEKQRHATKMIGELLGIRVKRLINEPSSASIACHRDGEDETFVVFDFGGGTLDVSVVDCFENVISICAIAGNNQLGGSDFDKEIALYFCLKNQLSFDSLNKKEERSLLLAAERAKIALQTQEKVNFSVKIGKKEYNCMLDNDILMTIANPIFEEIRSVISKAVKDSGFKANELDGLLLVGGSSYMPVVRAYLEKLLRIPVKSDSEIDFLVAKGLGKYLGIKGRFQEVKDIVVTDICPFSLATGIVNEMDRERLLSRVVIPRNSVLPTSRSVHLQVYELGQTDLRIGIYQGEAMYVDNNLLLGEINVKVPKNIEKHETFSLTYSYDINSMLYIELVIHSTKERYSYRLGEDNTLQKTTSLKHLHAIKDISIQLNQNPEYEAVMEKAQRIYEEIDVIMQDELRTNIQRFMRLFEIYTNNIKKKRQLIEIYNKYLDTLDRSADYNGLDIFADFEHDDDSSEGSML